MLIKSLYNVYIIFSPFLSGKSREESVVISLPSTDKGVSVCSSNERPGLKLT